MNIYDKDRQGVVLRIEKSSIHDGEGFRTVVFLKGCPLSCKWCSTPESQSFEVEKACDRVYGSYMTVEEVMREVRKDSLFYFHTGGGMTLSGGEPLSQPEFSLAILKNSRMECINTAVETSFYAPWKTIDKILPFINTLFIDLKIFDSELHKKFCGVDNNLILQNILNADKAGGNNRLVIRTPIIPGINDSKSELESIGEFCAGLNRLEYIQLLPYHCLGTNHKKLGRHYELSNVVRLHLNKPWKIIVNYKKVCNITVR